MLDRQFRPYLIEANSNPCLDNSGIILGKLIYELVDNVLMTAVDPLFPAPRYFSSNQEKAELNSIFPKTTFAVISLNSSTVILSVDFPLYNQL